MVSSFLVCVLIICKSSEWIEVGFLLKKRLIGVLGVCVCDTHLYPDMGLSI